MKIQCRQFLISALLVPLFGFVRNPEPRFIFDEVGVDIPCPPEGMPMTTGLTSFRGPLIDDEILTLKSSDVGSWAPDQLEYPATFVKRGFIKNV